MIIIHKLEMDMAENTGLPCIDAVQGDTNTRMLELTLTCRGEVWNIPADVSIRMRYCKSDGTKGIYDTNPDGTQAWSAEGNVITMALAPQMLTAAGAVFTQVELVLDTDVLATFTIRINVQRNPAAGVLQSEDYINMLQWMEAELDALLAEAKESGEFDGDSAYEKAVEAGYEGSEENFWKNLGIEALPRKGGTMDGSIDMAGNSITGLPEPVQDSDAVTKSYADEKRKLFEAVLYADSWGEAVPYENHVIIDGILDTDQPHISPVFSFDFESDKKLLEEWSAVSYAQTELGSMLFYCMERKPSVDIPIRMEVLR